MIKVTLIPGDGIGPEITESVIQVFDAAEVPIQWDWCDANDLPHTLQSIKNTGIALKAPLETPVGHGKQSINVTLRKTFDTYANVRPVFTIPNIQTPYSDRNLDLVIVRENTEDLYIGVEYDLSPNTMEARKIITREGCERICRFAFELARAQERPSVHCATKANILKKTEGLLKHTFEEMAKDYTEIQAHHLIVDNCAHQLMLNPEQFDVIVMSNMNGDILSDQASGLVGGLGVASSSNIGSNFAIFEAVHGSAPDIAGKGIANPTAFLWSAIQLLRHLELFDKATMIENALVKTFEDRFFTKDLDPSMGLPTKRFTQKIIKRLGEQPKNWVPRPHHPFQVPTAPEQKTIKAKQVIGVDLYIPTVKCPKVLGNRLRKISEGTGFFLKYIAYNGLTVFPENPGTFSVGTDRVYQCRFVGASALALLLEKLESSSLSWVQCQKVFEGPPTY